MAISSMKLAVSEIDFRKFMVQSLSLSCARRDSDTKKQPLVVLHRKHYPDTGFVSGRTVST